MRKVMQIRDERESAAARHPFFEWLESDAVSIDRRLLFMPQMALFIMQFRDQNRWSIRFPEPRDEFEWVINAGTLEDEKHSRLFLDDWREFGLDQLLRWRAGDMLWWLFLSEEQEVFRRSGVEFLALCVDDRGDPLIRFAHSEAGEAAGHVALTATAKIARIMSGRTGQGFRYFGDYHLELESGHVANTEGVFEEQILGVERREHAIALCHRMFDIFDRIFDAFLEYSQTYVEAGTVPTPSDTAFRSAVVDDGQESLGPREKSGDSRHARVWEALERRTAKVMNHPFYSWLDSNGELSPLRKLQRFVPLWVVDIFGSRDLYRYALSYTDPHDHLKRAINARAERLASRSGLFLGDWRALGLDDVLGSDAAGTLEFVFLDPDMDLFREQWVEDVKLALSQRDPAVRWWVMAALEAAGQACGGQAVRSLAREVEATEGLRLDYLTGRHEPAQAGTGREADHAPAPRLDDAGCAAAIAAVHAIFDRVERRLWRSLAVARANKLGVPT